MSLKPLDNLVKNGLLKAEQPNKIEFDGLVKSGINRLSDVIDKNLNLDSRFDLAYNASHSLALAALRWHGYRSNKRVTVFLSVAHTLLLEAGDVSILRKCHEIRNTAEYEGILYITDELVDELIRIVKILAKKVKTLPKIKDNSSNKKPPSRKKT